MRDFVILGNTLASIKRDITPICTIYGQKGLKSALIYFFFLLFLLQKGNNLFQFRLLARLDSKKACLGCEAGQWRPLQSFTDRWIAKGIMLHLSKNKNKTKKINYTYYGWIKLSIIQTFFILNVLKMIFYKV